MDLTELPEPSYNINQTPDLSFTNEKIERKENNKEIDENNKSGFLDNNYEDEFIKSFFMN